MVPIHVFNEVLLDSGSPLGSSELQAVMDKYRHGGKINYVEFMRNVRLPAPACSGEMHLTRNASADRAPPKSASNTDVTSTVGTTLTHTLFKPSYQWDGMDGPHNSGPPPVRRILAVSDHVACATRCT